MISIFLGQDFRFFAGGISSWKYGWAVFFPFSCSHGEGVHAREVLIWDGIENV